MSLAYNSTGEKNGEPAEKHPGPIGDVLSREAIGRQLATACFGREIIFYDTIGSTSTEANRLAYEGGSEGTVVVALRQSRGRGRLGRQWVSPEGGIYFSLILRPDKERRYHSQLVMVASVAAAKAIRRLTGAEARIKWPNDIVVGGKKIAGILLESSADFENNVYVIAGFGVNADTDASDLPEGAASLRTLSGRRCSRAFLISGILNEFEIASEVYRRGDMEQIREEWISLSATLGTYVMCRDPGGNATGLAVGIDEAGALLIRTRRGDIEKKCSGLIEEV